jgi:hypothetical protein
MEYSRYFRRETLGNFTPPCEIFTDLFTAQDSVCKAL